MADLMQFTCLIILLAMLAAAMATDIRSRRIPNILCITIAMLSIVYWSAASPHPLIRLMVQAASCAVLAALLIWPFAARLLGGGDVKLIAALCLWLPPRAAVAALITISLAGGLLAILMLIGRRIRPRPNRLKLPYGVAIVLGCLPVLLPRLSMVAERL